MKFQQKSFKIFTNFNLMKTKKADAVSTIRFLFFIGKL